MKTINIFPFIAMLFLSCWDMQDNQIERPTIPHYNLSGKVKGIDLNEPLDSVLIQMFPIQLLESDDYSSKYTFSNQNGDFHIDSVFVGSYYLYFHINDINIHRIGYFQRYVDSSLTVYLPCILNFKSSQRPANYTEFQSYSIESFSFNHNTGYVLLFDGKTFYKLKWDYNLHQWIELKQYNFPVETLDTTNTAIHLGINSNYFYAVVRPDNLYRIRIGAQAIEIDKSIKLDDYVRDVYLYENILYVAGIDRIYEIDEATLTLQHTSFINADEIHVRCFYRDELYFWIYDHYKNWLYQCNEQFDVLVTYQPVLNDRTIGIRDFSMDFSGKIWIIAE